MALLETLGNAVKNLFTDNDKRVVEYDALVLKLDAEAQARQVAIAAARAEVEAQQEPAKRLARLEAEELGHSYVATSRLNAIKNGLTDPEHLTAEHADFIALLERLYATVRATPPPTPRESINRVENIRTVTNLDELRRYESAVRGPLLDPEDPWSPRLPSAFQQAQNACAELWRLPIEAQRLEIAKHRIAIKESFRQTIFEHEL